MDVELFNSINCTIWDCSSKIHNFNYFILMNHISTVVIFCNLQNTNSCERIEYWKEIIDKYRLGILTIIVGTTLTKDSMNEPDAITIHEEASNTNTNTNRPKNKKVIERNTVNVLQWCVEHGDIPFFAIDLNNEDDVRDMYNSIFMDRLKKIIE